jgi:hypothetical protein
MWGRIGDVLVQQRCNCLRTEHVAALATKSRLSQAITAQEVYGLLVSSD